MIELLIGRQTGKTAGCHGNLDTWIMRKTKSNIANDNSWIPKIIYYVRQFIKEVVDILPVQSPVWV